MAGLVSFFIPGRPFAKQRPRSTRRGVTYTPKETVSFERQVGIIARPMFAVPFACAVRVEIEARFGIPKSWAKYRREAARGAWHTQKPDLDNIEKAILDGLNRIAFADDAQVAEVRKAKRWVDPDEEGTLVSILSLDTPAQAVLALGGQI